MIRRRLGLVVGACALAMLAACSSSGNKPSAPSSSAVGPTSISSTRVSSPASASESPTTAPTWTPPTYGAAQPAVTAYLTLQSLSDKAFTDPAKIPASTFAQYVTGPAAQVFDAALFNEKQAGRYYGGTPAEQRVTVKSMNLKAEPKYVVLYSCPLANSADPSTEYDAKTGKPVPAGPPPKVKPPYGHTVKMLELSGQWTAATFTVDATKTCSP